MAEQIVTGVLKFASLTKDKKKFTLTGEWDDNNEKQWISVDEAKVLNAEGVLERDGEWPEGGVKYKVIGTPTITLVKNWKGKECTTEIRVGEKGANTPQPSQNGYTLDDLVDLYAWAAVESIRIWGPKTEPETIRVGATNLFHAARDMRLKVDGVKHELPTDKPPF